MKKIYLELQDHRINKIIGKNFEFLINEDGNLIDVIKKLDDLICAKGGFPYKEYRSIVHMVYNPIENKLYTQVAINAYSGNGMFIHIRENPKVPLPDKTKIILIPAGGCMSSWEKVIGYDEFVKFMK
jgi:hypothetical protein